MATIITHPIIPITAAYLIGRDKVPLKLMIVATLASILPDLDVFGLRYGVPYGDQFGHRGFTHSIFFAVFIGLLASLSNRTLGASKPICFWLVFIGCCSHGVLDALTDGGSGIAFFWPITAERYFFPVTPIEVSPIGISRFLTQRGIDVLVSELWIIWIPALSIIFWKKIRSSKS